MGKESNGATNDRPAPSLGGVCVSVLLLRDRQSKSSPVNFVPERTGVFRGGKRRFYPTAAGQKSDEERLDFLVLLRFVRLSFAPSFCLLEFEPLVVTLEETLVCLAGCSFRSARSHLSGLTVSLAGQNVGHPATRPAEALAGGSGGQRPIPGAGVD